MVEEFTAMFSDDDTCDSLSFFKETIFYALFPSVTSDGIT